MSVVPYVAWCVFLSLYTYFYLPTYVTLQAYDRNQKGFLLMSEINELLDALGLPQSAVKVLGNSGDGLGTQVSYG